MSNQSGFIGERSRENTSNQVGSETLSRVDPYWVDKKNGQAVGVNYTVPNKDFSYFLGYAPPSAAELNGKSNLSGSRIIELSLQKRMQEIGEGATLRGTAYSNTSIAGSEHHNSPGKERSMINDTLDAWKEGPEKTNSTYSFLKSLGKAKNLGDATAVAESSEVRREAASPGMSPSMTQYFKALSAYQHQSKDDNIHYLEMQYKFQEMSKHDDTLSNLMKTRHDAITRIIRGSQG
jgi:hypothetical protein